MLPIQLNLRKSILILSGVQPRFADGAEVEDVEGGAVLGRGVVEIVHGVEAAGARHVLHHHRGIAGDVPAHVPRQHARIDVEAAARREAGQDVDGLALVEILRGGRRHCQRSQRLQSAQRGVLLTLAHGPISSLTWRAFSIAPSRRS